MSANFACIPFRFMTHWTSLLTASDVAGPKQIRSKIDASFVIQSLSATTLCSIGRLADAPCRFESMVRHTFESSYAESLDSTGYHRR